MAIRSEIEKLSKSVDESYRGQNVLHRALRSASRSEAEHKPIFRTMSILGSTVSLWIRADDGTFRPACGQLSKGRSNSEERNCEVMGAATKSSSPVSSNTNAGRTFAP